MTSLGKRKDCCPDGAADDPHQALFVSIPDVCWQLVSSFAAPPDVYNLSLSSKQFFRTFTSNDDEESSATPLLATRLLRQSLLSSLGRVLDNSQSGITLESALALADFEGSALIAGSTMAQTCLGVHWGGADVDVYCSADAAPGVRSWLVEQANCIFVGFKDYHIELADTRLSYTVDTKIHHVEKWGSIIQNLDREEKKLIEDAKSAGTDLRETLKNTEYYKDTSEYGKNCQQKYVDWKWTHCFSFDVLGLDPRDKVYNIKPKKGGDLPFDFYGDACIDLIVAKIGEDEVTLFDLLEDFDLTICKASFDGKTFRIPDPHRTFSAKSTMEPNRRAVVESYVKHFNQPPNNYYGKPIQQSALASATIKAVRKDVPNAPFYHQLDFAAALEDTYTLGSVYDTMVQAKYGASIQFHNWTRKLVTRLRKYQQRGIEVVDAPTIGDDVRLEEFSMTEGY